MDRRLSQQKLAASLPPPKPIYRLPHKKRQSIRQQLCKQDTVILHPTQAQKLTNESGECSKTKCRKPPKKQLTIRQRAKLNSAFKSMPADQQKMLKVMMNRKKEIMKERQSKVTSSCIDFIKRPTLILNQSSSKSILPTKLMLRKQTRENSRKKTVTIVDTPTEEPAMPVLVRQQETELSMPVLVRQETMPVSEMDVEVGAGVRVERKCRSLSLSAMPQTVVGRSRRKKSTR